MSNLTDLGVYVMNDPYDYNHNFKSAIIKLTLFAVALTCLITFPDVIAHFIAVVVHTVHETVSFVIEEFLRHGFGLDKNSAQMIVFYSSIASAIVFLIVLWRLMPAILNWIKHFFAYQFYIIKLKAVYSWHCLRTDQKIKLLLIHTAVMASAFMYLLA
jgi:hypothetical protein